MVTEMKQQRSSHMRSFACKCITMVLSLVLVLGMSVPCFAADTTPVDIDTLLSGVTGSLSDFSTANLTKIIVAGVGIAVGLVLLWFGFNYVRRKLMGALRKGRL